MRDKRPNFGKSTANREESRNLPRDICQGTLILHSDKIYQ